MKITVTNDPTPVRLNTLCEGMIFRNVVGAEAFVVVGAARGTAEYDGVAVITVSDLGLNRTPFNAQFRVSGHTPVVRLYVTDITLTEIAS